MKRLALASLITTALCVPARADPITLAVGSVTAWYASIGVAGQLAVQVGISLALAAASAGISYLVSGGGQRTSVAAADNSGTISSESGVQDAQRSGLLDRRRLYGTQVVSGGIFFQETIGSGGGTLNRYVLGFAVGDGICDGLEAVIVNGTEVPVDAVGNPQIAPWYNVAGNLFKVSFRGGASTQAMDPIIAAYWPTPPADFYPDAADRITRWAKFRQRGVATIVIDVDFGGTADNHTALWGAGGIPDLKFRVRGLKVYNALDPNADPDTASTWVWSDLAALIEVDWLRNDMGFGVATSEIDWDSVKAAATIDSEWIPTLDGIERRGRINGVVVGTEANDAVLSSMALQNRALIRRAFGKYNIRADSTRDPVSTIHQGLIVGALSYQNEADTRATFTRVVAQFAPASMFNQSAETTYTDPSWVAGDAEQRVSLRFCDSPAAAQRLGYAQVIENQSSRTLTGSFDISCLIAAGKPDGQLLEAGDVERVWFSVYQAMNGLYTNTSIEIGQDFTVTLSLAGYDPAVIDGWTVALEVPFEVAA